MTRELIDRRDFSDPNHEKGLSWVVFSIALCFYWATAGDSVAFWDCPEYVTVASLLEVGHPPGNPLWALAMRVATMFFPSSLHAFIINLCSGLFMALSAMFLCRILFIFSESVFPGKVFISGIASFSGALCFALCGSAWFSAVEAEVYAMSAFLTSLSILIMLIGVRKREEAERCRYYLLVFYLTGLSLGVHELGLLCIPVYAFIYLFYRREKISFGKCVSLLALSFVVTGLILFLATDFILYLLGRIELFSVNSLGLSYLSGLLIFLFLCFVFIFAFISQAKNSLRLTFAGWSFVFILVGFSSFAMILIRGAASPPMNEGTPGTVFQLASYVSRDQYGKKPLLYGPTPYSGPLYEEIWTPGDSLPEYSRYLLEKGKPQYYKNLPQARLAYRSGFVKDEDEEFNNVAVGRLNDSSGNTDSYLLSDYSYRRMLTPELNMWFPRISSNKKGYFRAYQDWAGMSNENMQEVEISETRDSLGNFLPKLNKDGVRLAKTAKRPTYLHHLKYFLTYQTGYMYLRYLGWNFIGRQNDVSSLGEIDNGNVLTGVTPIDNAMLGDSSLMPDYIARENRGRNIYFGIPFLFGVIGILYLFSKGREGRRVLWIITLFFLMTGIAIVVYLNQNPAEPRERDYTFLGSYMAFSIWVGIGAGSVGNWLIRDIKYRWLKGVVGVMVALSVPVLFACNNYDDNDRKNRLEPKEFAKELLQSEDNSIIFSQGDNSTFPLWYVQEVENIGGGHTVVDVSYLYTPQYVINLKKQGGKGLETVAKESDIAYGAYAFVEIPKDTLETIPLLEDLLKTLYAGKDGLPRFSDSRFRLPLSPGDTSFFKLKDFTGGSSYMTFRQLMLLDILASNMKEGGKRLYFPNVVESSFTLGLDSVLSPALYGKTLAFGDKDLEEYYRKEIDRIILLTPSPAAGYLDALTKDEIRKRRTGLIEAAKYFIDREDFKKAEEIVLFIDKKYPFEIIEPDIVSGRGSYSYDGQEFVGLLKDLYVMTGNPIWHSMGLKQSQMQERLLTGWTKYYNSLSETQKDKLSLKAMRKVGKLKEIREQRELFELMQKQPVTIE